MNLVLTTLKIILLVIGLPLLLLGFIIGTPFLIIAIPGLLGAFAIDRYQAKASKLASSSAASSTNSIWNLVVLAIGIALYFAITTLGSLGNLDTTGTSNSGEKNFAAVFSVLVVILGLVLVNRKRDNS